MLRRNKFILSLIVASVVLMAAVLYGQVVTNTFLSSVSDHGGTLLADVSGLAWHIFGVTTAVSYDLSYSTTVRHNGSFVADDWHQVRE